jgi:GT2 family glycosyltransferase
MAVIDGGDAAQRVRVVILHYNQPVMTARCVAYVDNQSYAPLDVVVVDNASTPENYEILRGSLPRHVTLIRNQANLGYAAGNNVGVRPSAILKPAAYTMILNGDAFLLDPATLDKLIDGLRGDPERVAATPLVNTGSSHVAPERQIQVCRASSFGGFLVAYSWWLRWMPFLKGIADRHFYKERMPYSLDHEYECDTVHGCCFVIRTDFFESIGYFDEGTFLYFEEMILARQIKDRGKKCCLVTSVVVDHVGGAATRKRSLKGDIRVQRASIKSQLYFCRKYLRVGLAGRGLLVLVRIIGFVGKEVYEVLRGLGRSDDRMANG